jgi:hypothetical protein
MSKGTRWTQQSYKVDSTFPYEWIKKKWREDFQVTAMATSGWPNGGKQQWAVVMSRDADFRHQVVEVDFQYPSEGIHYHWNKGARPHLLGWSLPALCTPVREPVDLNLEKTACVPGVECLAAMPLAVTRYFCRHGIQLSFSRPLAPAAGTIRGFFDFSDSTAPRSAA